VCGVCSLVRGCVGVGCTLREVCGFVVLSQQVWRRETSVDSVERTTAKLVALRYCKYVTDLLTYVNCFDLAWGVHVPSVATAPFKSNFFVLDPSTLQVIPNVKLHYLELLL
jgi:hypothetical protein